MVSKYEQAIYDRYQAAQRQVINDQKLAAQRQAAQEQARRQAEEEDPGILGKAGSLIGGFLDKAWTDDFSAVPIIGPIARETGNAYTSSTRGISAGLSAGLLAANPEYWQNRGEGADLFDDAFRVQPGRAAVALGDAADDLSGGFLRRSGALGPVEQVRALTADSVYQQDPNFDIANDAQRDRMFGDSAARTVSSGLVDGLATWFLDPLVIGSKGVKIARFGTTAMGLDRVPGVGRFTTGLTNRTLIDQRGYNSRVFKAVEQEADEALAFAEGRGGVETPIGILGERVARGSFEDLLELNAFQGASRDLLAAAGSSITNKADGIIFIAAAAGSRKYQGLLRDRATAIYAGLQQTAGKYEQKLLNTPLGAEQKPILSEPLSKDFSVEQLIRDLRKRDSDLDLELQDLATQADRTQGLLRAADLAAEGGEVGLIEKVGGTNVFGMRVAQAWRDGRAARSYAKGYKEGMARRANDSFYGTAPAIVEKVFQASGIFPKVRVWDWVRGYQASGFIDIQGFNVGKSTDELKAALSDSRTVRKNKEFVAEQLRIYGAASTTTERMAAVQRIEKNVTQLLADEATKRAGGNVISAENLEEVYRIIDKRRAEVVGNFRSRAYGVDPEDGSTIITKPMLRSQLETSMPMLNLRMLEKTIEIAAKPHYREVLQAGDQLKLVGNGLTSQSVKNFFDEVQSIWKAGVLLRLGYTIRNTGEGWLRTAAFLGSVPALAAAPGGLKNSFFNNYRRVRSMSVGKPGAKIRGHLPTTGVRRVLMDEDRAAQKIDEIGRRLEGVRAQRAEALAANPAVAVTQFDDLIRQGEAEIKGLQQSLDALTRKRQNLQARRGVGDDGAFGGELNAEYADLYRRLSSADQTTKNFLESAWARGQDEILSQSAWARISPDKPQYWQELSGAVRQFRADEVSKRLLDGEDIGSVVAWLRSAAGRDYRREMRVSKEAAEQRVTELADMIRMYLPTDEARRLAATGQPDAAQLRAVLGMFQKTPKKPREPKPEKYETIEKYYAARARYEERLAKYNEEQAGQVTLSPIHGREVAGVIGGAESLYVKARKETIDRLFNLLGTYPESTLVRHPFYAEVWQRRFGQLQQQYIDQGVEITPELLKKINTSSHRAALRATNETLYTIERYSNPASVMRWMAPFFAAWENSFRVWTRMVVNDPSILVRASLLWNIPNQLGMVVDREGNPVEASAFDFLTGSQDQFIVLPDAVNKWVEERTGGVPLKIPRGSLNIVTPGNTPFLPGFGPTVTYPVGKFLASKPDTQKFLRDWAGDYLYEQIAPFGVPQSSLADTFMPAWMRKQYEAWQGEDSADYLRVTGAMWQTAMVEWYKSGGRPEDKPDADVVMQRANDFYKFSTLASLVLPFATTRMSPYQLQVDDWNRLKADPTMTYAEKVDAFLTNWGDDFLPLITSTSKTDIPSVDPTIEDYNVLQDHSDLARSLSELDPNTVGILAASAPIGEFDEGVYKWLNENNVPGADGVLRGPRGVGEMGEAITMQAAWRDYRRAKEKRDAALAAVGVKSMDAKAAEGIKAAWNEFVNVKMVEEYGEQWVVNYRSYQDRTPANLVGITTALNNEKFMQEYGNTPMWEQIQTYMRGRQNALDAIAAGADSADVRRAFGEWAAEHKYSSLAFADFYDKFLDQDNLQDIGVSSLG